MNIFLEIAKGHAEERMLILQTLIRSGKSLKDADAETEQYMCNKYGRYWRTGMPPSYFDRPQPKRKSFIQRIKDFFGTHE